MRKKLVIATIITMIATIVLTTGCTNSKEKKTDNPKVNKSEKEDEEKNISFEDEKKILAGQVIEYKFDSNDKSGKIAELDLDSDGKKDTIELGKIISNKKKDNESLKITVNGSSVKFKESAIEQVVSAVAFDDKHILLATYAKGKSDAPHTSFYMYSNKKLKHVGDINNDIRELNNKKDNMVTVKYFDTVLESKEEEGTLSNYVFVKYRWDGKKLFLDPYHRFDYVNQNEAIKVIKPIKTYLDPARSSRMTEVTTTIIYPIMKGEDSWNYIKTKEGTECWIDLTECTDCFVK